MSGLDLNITVTITASEALLDLLAALIRPPINPPSPAVSTPARTEAAGVLPRDVLSVGGSSEGPGCADEPNLSAGAAATRPRRPFQGWLTAERKAVLAEVYPTAKNRAEWYGAVAQCPGPALPPIPVVQNRAWLMGLRRPPEAIPESLRASIEKQRAAKSALIPPAAATGPGASQAPKQPVAPAPIAAEPTRANTPPIPPPQSTGATFGDAIRESGLEAKLIAMARPPAAAPPPVPRPAAAPIEAGQNAIHAWFLGRGKTMDEFDLARVNQEAARLGHPGFVLKQTERRHA